MAQSLAMRGISRTNGDYLMFNLFVGSEIPLDAVLLDSSTKQIASWAILSMQKHALISGSTHTTWTCNGGVLQSHVTHTTNINYIISFTRSAAILINVYLRLQLVSHPE